ncbi:two-component regulator propeller domain-containing protein [Gelidibacter salicanalis]|uniref:histidine kinase n=1 Tax=Gelidibacter salicanalis TaxID=291193 RepID=A0A934NCF2_9FLAO|nr:two-component regulator propeller domain-containing protein [Gelidibacter salicanalis]MBJ7880650.1 response regulator [Gelidibacter salicanalis]
MRNRIVFLGLFFVLAISLEAQELLKDYSFVNIKAGISNVGMSTIVQDSHGFIWIGTNGDGLYKYNGIDYISYKNQIKDSTSISSSLIYCSYIDSSNRLWVGTEEGLNLYDHKKDQFQRFYFSPKDVPKNSNISVSALAGDKEGNLFIGTFERGFFKLEKGSNTFEKIPFGSKDPNELININGIAVHPNGKVYAGSSLGLLEFDSKSKTLIPTYFNVESGMETIKNPIQSVFIGKDKSIWLGTISDGLIKATKGDNEKGEFSKIERFPYTEKRVLAMVQLSDHSIMVGTENDGLFHLTKTGNLIKNYLSNKTDKHSISSNSIWSLFVDRDERIWLGYYNSGVAVYDRLYDKFDNIESLAIDHNSLEVSSVTGIAKDGNGDFWISMDGGGIDIYNPKTHKVRHINKKNTSTISGLNTSDIQTIFIDSKSNVWAGSWNNGLYLLKKGSSSFINFNISTTPKEFRSNSILSFDEDSKGTIWIGTFYNGLMSYDPTSGTFTHYNTKDFLKHHIYDKAVRKVLVDSDDHIWIGTTQGLYKIFKNGIGEFVVEPFQDKMRSQYNRTSANHILSLYEGMDKSIWIGTRGSGLSRYNKKEDTLQWYNTTTGLLEENVSAITESQDGNIWISGNSGLSALNFKKDTIINYTVNDGLLSNDFNFNAVYRDNEGTLYFGNYEGIDYFNPKDLKTNTSVPDLYLTGLKIFNVNVGPSQKNSPLTRVISETDSIALTYKQNVFTIEYTGINYTRPEKNQYAYYLEGLEKTWNYVGNARNATYTNLDHGDYVFKLKSANNDGVWNENVLTLKITILPPWWRTNLAITSYIILFFLGIYLLNKITKNRLRDKESLRIERIQRVKEDELHEKKLQFFTNISHEFRTPLTLMINPLKDIINDETLQLPERVKQKHNIIYKNTDRLYRLINELMDLRKLELNKVRIRAGKLNAVSFTKEIMSYFKEEAYHKNIVLSLDADVPEIGLWADQGMLEKIIFNILSNALKVTPEGGTITVDVVSNDELESLPLVNASTPVKVVKIIISDTGPGLKKKQAKRIFERFYQVENLNKTYYGGTGIGLEVVKSFVELHKGKIEVDSELGQGTTFTIIFPKGNSHFSKKEVISHTNEMLIQKEQHINIIPQISTIDEELEDLKNVKANKLLIVEDNAELKNYLKDELKKTYKILLASNGKEGLEIAKQSLPDVIITDVIMPEMDGFDFCKHIKTDIRTSHIPLLMLTAKSQMDDRIEGISYGADAYMVKPFDLRLLKLRLAQLITSRKLIFDKYFGAISGAEENANATSIDKEFIQKILSYIHENISDNSLSVEVLASQLNLSRSQLYRKIKTLTGQTVNEFIRKIRLEKAKQILQTGNSTISEVSFKVGFSSPSYFTKCFKSHFGQLPTDIEINES